ncbi:calcineurin subunit B type 1-like [Lytechinus variegatus]|uniref:calcineurin subunit B type 1-like n=1 Tax=Lytechinus variegatus TaxID=7654 RepID=UPI001BB0D8BA|nr:calcineurin subunit B type 1-like [Lytechinus variegatus]
MGNSDSILTPEKLEDIEKQSHFDEREIKFLLKTYAKLDPSPNGEDGIPVESFLSLYIFAGNELARRVAMKHATGADRTIQPEGFLMCLSVLCKKADYREKSKALFDALDVNKEGLLRFEQLFSLYKGMFTPALTDDQITEAVIGALQKVRGEHPGTISYQEFLRMVSPSELKRKMTIDIPLPT